MRPQISKCCGYEPLISINTSQKQTKLCSNCKNRFVKSKILEKQIIAEDLNRIIKTIQEEQISNMLKNIRDIWEFQHVEYFLEEYAKNHNIIIKQKDQKK